jgi:hypothetical protein
MQASNYLMILGKRLQERPIGTRRITISSSKVQRVALTTHVKVRCGQLRYCGHNSLFEFLSSGDRILTESHDYFSENYSPDALQLLTVLGLRHPAILVVEIEQFGTISIY